MCEQEKKDTDTHVSDTACDTLQEQLALYKESAREWQEKFARVSADFQNYQRRMASEQLLWTRRAQDEIFIPLIAVLDDFDRALQVAESDNEWVKGFALIHAGLEKLLASYGVKPMDNYTIFDPQFHEALMQVDAQNHDSGTIVEVLQKGYLRNDDVLRPAKVSVAK